MSSWLGNNWASSSLYLRQGYYFTFVKDVCFRTFFQITAKEQELQMAAQLGKQMLERNDDLQEQLEILRQDHSNVVQVGSGRLWSDHRVRFTCWCDFNSCINSLRLKELHKVTSERDAFKHSLDSLEVGIP